ncbi:DegT/DnrJ/EryC1/StrS family aminotransferase [Desmospora profundinema]|uniref:dTDP-4-amino-4,6-dideoxygalactose transaminase n=1 Tax=Desmospora profundinema TaxID=1571184 RepID=A0ABU1ILH7_9BACL|nr:DegT/DnrJ/EryC1/StrS family aminotransferase [Desmospora profundinema]MDR6225546.1 dTDP-4-amino-4,6-dideoxygalactose transaminase [Desmospora profundinema]
MNDIPLLDLKAQYHSIKEELNQAAIGVMESGRYVLGPEVAALEREVASLSDAKHGIGVANGTDALLLALDAMGIGPGDEVITSPFTFFATAEVISQRGATPVFVDIDPDTYNLDIHQLEEKVTARTKAVIPVHLFGQPADMDPVNAIAGQYGLWVLEDAAQAIGARYNGAPVGSHGHAASYSFFPTKNLGGYGDGGMIVTSDDELAEKIRILRVHGSNPKYYHSMVGYNSRLDELQAALLRVKLKYLSRWNEDRRERAMLYDRLLEGLPVVRPVAVGNRIHIYHLYIVQVEDREGMAAHLRERGIATGVYYPVPLHLQNVYRGLGYDEGDLPVAEAASKRTLALPLYPEMEEEMVMRVADAVKEFFS